MNPQTTTTAPKPRITARAVRNPSTGAIRFIYTKHHAHGTRTITTRRPSA